MGPFRWLGSLPRTIITWSDVLRPAVADWELPWAAVGLIADSRVQQVKHVAEMSHRVDDNESLDRE